MLDVKSSGRLAHMVQNSPWTLSTPQRVQPVSPMSQWVLAHGDATQSDNGVADITDPAGITVDRVKIVRIDSTGTSALISARYVKGALPGSIVVQAFGFDRTHEQLQDVENSAVENPVPMKLWNKDEDTDLTLTGAAPDPEYTSDGVTYCFTAPVEIDLQANAYLLVAVKTAATAAASIHVKVK